MKIIEHSPAREFGAGRNGRIRLKDCAKLILEPDEQVTFSTESGMEYDVTRKSWGFYATPSLNWRLMKYGLRAVLVRSPENKYHVLLVEKGREDDFERYLKDEDYSIVCWMDSEEILQCLENAINRKGC